MTRRGDLVERDHHDTTTVVEGWRELQLLEAGYPARQAAELAFRTDIDLHVAVKLLRDQHCPLRLAMKILL